MHRLWLGALAALAIAGPAGAATFGFDCIGGATVACGVGEASLSVDVAAGASGTVTLTFSNSDSGTSSLVGIFIDDSELIASARNAGGAGTAFKKNGKPRNLPAAGSVSFVDNFRFNALKPRASNGVNGGETLTIVLRLRGQHSIADVMTALGDGTLRFGLLINDADPSCVGENPGPQCGGDVGAASFVNLPNPVPEPVAALLGGLACLGLALCGRRR